MQLKREQFDQTNPFARQEALIQMAQHATPADLQRVLASLPPPGLESVMGPVVGTGSSEGEDAGISFTAVPMIPLGAEPPAPKWLTRLPRTPRTPRLNRSERMRRALTETREYLRYALQLQRVRIARWMGRQR